jgi:SAM-dependent methyltransferase
MFVSGLSWVSALGVEPLKTLNAIRNLPVTIKEHLRLRRQNASLDDRWSIWLSSPSFNDRNELSGVASGHYFHQDLLVARLIYQRRPERHVDVGSRLDGFVAHVAVFREIEVIDIRPAPLEVENVRFRQWDLMNPPKDITSYCDSISCLHALEHFGLGRYGDPIDAEGYKKGFKNIAAILKSGGVFYLSVPVGVERIEFNGQRVFSLARVQRLYEQEFYLEGFSYIDDEGKLHTEVHLDEDALANNLELVNGCGIFELIKR